MGVDPPLIYRVPLRSEAIGVDHARQVAYCLAHGVVGPGWGLPPPPPASLEEALERLRRISKSGADTVRRFAAAPTGSFVWSRNLSGRYLLGRLDGEWRFDASPDAEAVDLQHVRPVAWAPRALLDDEVPAAVVRAWAGRGTSFSQIHSSTARLMSVRVFDELTGAQPQPLSLSRADVVRELLHPLDVEDLVCTFLQVREDYLVLPGSHRSDTPAHEQVLVSRADGHRAIVQVKTGDTFVDLELLRAAAADDTRAFAYSTTGKYLGDPKGVQIIDEDELLEFACDTPQFLPRRVRRAFEYIEKSEA
jgi:hypothetical protein